MVLVSTLNSWDGASSINSFGEGGTATYGQTFTVPTSAFSARLDSFSFKINDTVAPVKFQGFLAAWNGTNATGSILYTSSNQTTTGALSFETFTFNTGGINLTPGAQYVFFTSASNLFDGTPDESDFGSIINNPYSGGNFVFSSNVTDFNSLFSASWGSQPFPLQDLAFEASFSVPIPTPSIGITTIPSGSGNLILGNNLNNIIVGTASNDTIYGYAGNDQAYGLDGNDYIDGGIGNDTLFGLNGNDTLVGRAGNDTLIGGSGNDFLVGGADADSFTYIAPNEGSDTIANFNAAFDRFLISTTFGGGLAVGVTPILTLGALPVGATAQFLYSGGVLRFDADGTGIGVAQTLATLTGVPALAATNIVVF